MPLSMKAISKLLAKGFHKPVPKHLIKSDCEVVNLADVLCAIGEGGDNTEVVAKLCDLIAVLESGITVTLSAESIAAIESLLGPLLVELEAINQNTANLGDLLTDINANLAAIIAELVALNAELTAQGDKLDGILELLQDILDALMAFCDIAITDVCSSVDGRPLLAQVIKAQTGGAPVYSLVEMDGSPVTDGSAATACGVDREKVAREMCAPDGSKWLSCSFVNVADPTDAIGPVFISPNGAIAEPPEGLTLCKTIADVIKECPTGPPGSDPTRGFQYINGRPNANAPWQLISNLDGQNNTVVIEGATLAEFVANMEAAGYTEWSNAEQHYFCPCPPGYTEAGSYTIKVDGETSVKIDCLPLAELPNAPTKEDTTLDVVCTKDKNSDAMLAKLCEIAANTAPDPDCCTPPEGQILGGAGSDTVTVAGNFEGVTELDVVQADGTTETVAVTSAVYNETTNTTTATLQQATAVKAVKLQRRTIEAEGGK